MFLNNEFFCLHLTVCLSPSSAIFAVVFFCLLFCFVLFCFVLFVSLNIMPLNLYVFWTPVLTVTRTHRGHPSQGPWTSCPLSLGLSSTISMAWTCPPLRSLLQCHLGKGTHPEHPVSHLEAHSLPSCLYHSIRISFPNYHTFVRWVPAFLISCDGNLGCWLTAAPQRPV